MSALYLFFLAVGAPLLLWMVFFGDGDGDGFGIDGDGEMTVVPLSAIAAFMTTFGGIGVIGQLTGAGFLATLVLAVVLAVAVGYASHRLFKWIKMPGATSEVTDFELEGKIARVSIPISSSFRGRIVVDMAGASEQMTAAPADGSSMDVGDAVVIVRIERGVALVAPLIPDLSLE